MHITAQKCALQNACPRHESGQVFNLNGLRAVARRKRHTSNYHERAPELSDARSVFFKGKRTTPFLYRKPKCSTKATQGCLFNAGLNTLYLGERPFVQEDLLSHEY